MKKKMSILCNSLIIIFELIAIIITVKNNGRYPIEYYTDDSNLLALFSSILFLYFLIRKNKVPRGIQLLKYATTVGLALTFFVVLLLLGPMYNFAYVYMFTHEAMLYTHLLCPILGMVTFLFFDDIEVNNRKDSIYSLVLTFLYATILIICNTIGLVDGPYPFLKVREQAIYMSFIWCFVVLGMAYFLSFVLRKLKYRKK